MSFDGLHETVIKDVIDIVKDGIDQADALGLSVRKSNSLSSASSLSKATEGLILVFPHLCSMNVSPETSRMLNKAIETKAVSLLQIAFSAFNITNSTDAVDFVRQFHTNIGRGKMSVDNFIDALDSAANESASLNGVNRNLVRSVLEEFKQMECYFEEDLSEGSLNDFKVVNRYGSYVVTEARKKDRARDIVKSRYKDDLTPEADNARYDIYNSMVNNDKFGDKADGVEQRYYEDLENERQRQHYKDVNNANNRFRAAMDANAAEREKKRNEELDKYKRDRDAVADKFKERELENREKADANKQFKDDFDMLRQQMLPSDIKKANEMVPSMMIINFIVRDKDQTPIRSQAVIGVKAKLYPAASDDIINKIIVKNTDNNVFLKLMRVSTRELNFVKDFLLAIDDAKLSAVSCSTRGSDTNKFLKVLERRALKGKIRRTLNMNNAYKAITTLTITRSEADFINRYNNIDVFNVNIIRKIMESLNIMMFIVADDTEECAYIIMDSGDDMFEKISYTHLERESMGGDYKKAINLMTKALG